MSGRRQSQPYVTRNQQRAAALRRQNTVGNIQQGRQCVKVKKNIQTVIESNIGGFTEFWFVVGKPEENPSKYSGEEEQETQCSECYHSCGGNRGSLDRSVSVLMSYGHTHSSLPLQVWCPGETVKTTGRRTNFAHWSPAPRTSSPRWMWRRVWPTSVCRNLPSKPQPSPRAQTTKPHWVPAGPVMWLMTVIKVLLIVIKTRGKYYPLENYTTSILLKSVPMYKTRILHLVSSILVSPLYTIQDVPAGDYFNISLSLSLSL